MKSNERQAEMDLPTLEPLPEAAFRTRVDARGTARDPWSEQAALTRVRSSVPAPGARWLRTGAVVIATTTFGAVLAHRYDQWSRPVTPRWIQTCREAIDANARLHQARKRELDQAQYEAWSIIGGLRIKPTPLDASLDRRLQRNADEAINRCISPTSP
jgi:hypothetical protein